MQPVINHSNCVQQPLPKKVDGLPMATVTNCPHYGVLNWVAENDT
jgi:hypothetical protein